MKLKIAVCDDDHTIMDNEAFLVTQICREKNIDAEVEKFNSPSDLLLLAKEYNIAILDIEMHGMNGITLAKQLAEKNPECYKIFITNYSVYLDKAFDANAVRFLTKPVDKDRLSGGIDSIIARMNDKQKVLHITAQKTKIITEVRISSIVCVETAKRHARIISAKHGTIEAKESFSKLKSMIGKEVNYFCQSHQSFYVNMKYVTQYDKESVVLKYAGTAYQVPMSRRQYKIFRKKFFELAKAL